MPDSPRAVRPWLSYKERVSRLAQRIVEAQRPIRVLNAIKWDPSVFESFRDSNWRRLPYVSAADYARIALGFDPDNKRAEFATIIQDINNDLPNDGVGDILRHTSEQYVDVVGMLQARGTPRFYELSRRLYGSPKDVFFSSDTRVRDVSQQMYDILTGLDDRVLGAESPRDITAERAVEVLNARLSEYFGERNVRVILDDGIVADAAAGSDYIKVRRGAMFSERDLKLLEVHEGWVHVATSMNGQAQPVARWLSIGPP